MKTVQYVFPVPEFMAPPEVSALSSTSLKVTWSTAEDHGVIARGQVTDYRVNLLTEQTNNPYAPPVISQVSTFTHKIGNNCPDNLPKKKELTWQKCNIQQMTFILKINAFVLGHFH